MEPDDSAKAFDALLSARIVGAHDPMDTPPERFENELAVVERIAAGKEISPSSVFAKSLKARFLEAVEVAQIEQSSVTPSTLSSLSFTEPSRQTYQPGARFLRSALRSRRIQLAALAAILLIALGGGLLLTAASAPPASPLYIVRRVEQSVRVQVALNKDDAVQLHVTYADQALASLTDAASRHDLERYRAALATLIEEDSAAAAAANSAPPGDQRTRLEAIVAQLRVREVTGLRTALPALGWHDRIDTTSAVIGIGAHALTIMHAEVSKVAQGKGNEHQWQVTVTGQGFQPGAILLVNENPRGVVMSVTDGVLIAAVADGPIQGDASVGVGNPDNTAASTNQITRHDISDGSQSAPVATPTHGNGNGGNPHGGTPTPTRGQSRGKP